MSSSRVDAHSSSGNGKCHSDYDVEAVKGVSEEYAFEDALRMIGFGKVQIEVLLVCGVILMAVLNETMGIGIITMASQCDFQTDSYEKGIMSASCLIGIFVSSFLWGYLSDTTGRRTVVLRTMTAAVIFSLVSMFTSNLWVFIFFRFCTGIGISGASATIYAYLGEFNTVKYRPIVINYASMFVGISLFYFPAMAWVILPQTWTFSFFGLFVFRPWRILILLNLLPGLIGTIWMLRLPETPKLYLSHGKTDEALKVLYWVYETNTGKPSKNFKVKRLKPEINADFMATRGMKKTAWEIAAMMWKQTWPLCKPPYLLNFAVCCFVMFGLFLISGGMGLWYPEIQNRLGIGASDEPLTVCDVINLAPVRDIVEGTILDTVGFDQLMIDMVPNDASTEVCSAEISTKTYVDSMTLGASYVVAYLVLGVVINPLGRKAVLVGSLTLSGLCGIALEWVDEPALVVVLFCGFLMLPGLCISVMSGVVVELIPTHLRGKAVCICFMLGRLGGVVGSYLIGAILETDCRITFYIFSGFILLCSCLTLLLPI